MTIIRGEVVKLSSGATFLHLIMTWDYLPAITAPHYWPKGKHNLKCAEKLTFKRIIADATTLIYRNFSVSMETHYFYHFDKLAFRLSSFFVHYVHFVLLHIHVIATLCFPQAMPVEWL